MYSKPHRRRGAIATLIALPILCAGLPALADGTRLTGDALKQAFAGKTFTGTTSRGGTWQTTYTADGRMEVRVVDSDWSDSGTWEVKNDSYCSERSKRAYRCMAVYRTGPGQFEFVDDRGETTKASYVN